MKVLLLHNIRSAHNVGSVFRTADAAGVGKIYLSGYTPLPVDKFGRIQKEIAKTALGAEAHVPWERAASPARLLDRLVRSGYVIVGIEQDKRSKDYRTLRLSGDTLFILGSEVKGMSKQLRERCHELIEIPMRGKKESLNVSVAAGIILFSFLDQ